MADIEFTGNNVPVAVAARAMKKDQMFIRLGLQKGILPIGVALRKDNSTVYDYYISPKLLYEFTGYLHKDESTDA